MYIFYYIIQISALVFQESSDILSFQEIEENTKKSGSVDYRSILYIIVKAIASLILIHFHLNKLIRQYHLRVASFSKQHMINSLLNTHYSK